MQHSCRDIFLYEFPFDLTVCLRMVDVFLKISIPAPTFLVMMSRNEARDLDLLNKSYSSLFIFWKLKMTHDLFGVMFYEVQTSCLYKSLVLKCFHGLEREKNYRIWLPTSGISSCGISQGKIIPVNWLHCYRFLVVQAFIPSSPIQ